MLRRSWLWVRAACNPGIAQAWLAGDGEAGPLDDLLGHSIAYRIAVGPRAGQKLFTLQTVPARPPEQLEDRNVAARAGAFSLHAGIDIAPHQRPKLERPYRYVSRPLVAAEHMALTSTGHVRYALLQPDPTAFESGESDARAVQAEGVQQTSRSRPLPKSVVVRRMPAGQWHP